VENPQPDMLAIEMTDEEIWRTIRDLDPDQRRNTSALACVIAIAVCVVLPDFRCLQVIGKIAGGSATMIRKMRDTACCVVKPTWRLRHASVPNQTAAFTSSRKLTNCPLLNSA